jgi:hypothetical protein
LGLKKILHCLTQGLVFGPTVCFLGAGTPESNLPGFVSDDNSVMGQVQQLRLSFDLSGPLLNA